MEFRRVLFRSTLERVARVLAGEEASINAHGSSSSAGDEVDAAWRDRIDDAVAVLKTLREPDEEMARAGDAAMWLSMIEAALACEDEVRGGRSEERRGGKACVSTGRLRWSRDE